MTDAPTDEVATGGPRTERNRSSEWWWYVLAGVSYVNLGIWHRWLLNWVIGPFWLVAVVSIGPAVVDAVRRHLVGGRR